MTGDFIFGVVIGVAGSITGYVLSIVCKAHFGE